MGKTDKKSEKQATDESVKEISETFGGSPVTSDATGEQTETEVDLSKAKLTVPKEALTETVAPISLDDKQKADLENREKAFEQRASDASIGLIQVDGGGWKYVGVAPALDEKAETPDGRKISSFNSTFTPISEVRFDPSVRVKDAKSGEYYFPTDASNWNDVNLNGEYLIPREVNKEAAKYRSEAATK